MPHPGKPSLWSLLVLTLCLCGCDEKPQGRNIKGDISVEALDVGPRVIEPAMSNFLNTNDLAGGVGLVVSPQKTVVIEAFGYADINEYRKMQTGTLFWIASMTKPMTAVAFMTLVEEGKVSLDDPIEKYIPAFRGQKYLITEAKGNKTLTTPKRPVCVRDLLTHTHGLSSSIIKDSRNSNRAIDLESLEHYTQDCASQPLSAEPGTQWNYSNLGFIVLGRIIEVVSGQTYGDFMQSRLFQPLQMTDTTFWPTPEQCQRMATAYRRDNATNKLIRIENPRFTYPLDNPGRTPLPSGGLFSNGPDLSHFYQMILNEGNFKGKSLIRPETLRLMITNQLGDMPKVGWTHGLTMGLGFQCVKTPIGVTDGLNAGTFGHGGAYGTQAWIDPVRKRAYILLIQRGDLENPDGSEMRLTFQKAALQILK